MRNRTDEGGAKAGRKKDKNYILAEVTMKNRIKKLKTKAKSKELAKTILSICAVSGGVCLLGAFAPRSATKLGKIIAQYSSWRIKECLKRLSMQNYIKYDEFDLDKPIYITKLGLERYNFQSLKDKVKSFSIRKWDHLWRLVTFDVKESFRYKRDGLRRKLLSLGFYKLQKNIFVIPFPVEDELEEIIASFRLWNRAIVLQVANLGRHEEKVKKYFLDNARNKQGNGQEKKDRIGKIEK